VAEEDGFDQLSDGGLFVGVEVAEGFEVEAQVGVGGVAFAGFEDVISANGPTMSSRSSHRR
jgi:hypothetical protein